MGDTCQAGANWPDHGQSVEALTNLLLKTEYRILFPVSLKDHCVDHYIQQQFCYQVI